MKKIKVNWKNVIIFIFIGLCLTGLTISLINIRTWKKDGDEIKKQVKEIEEKIDIEEVIDNANTKIIEQVEEVPEYNAYWNYIKMNLINVDFNELKKTNNQTVGWLQVNGTNINYPFVQTDNNEYYLKHSFDKSYNSAGWVFLDYRNNIKELHKNTIIYAHGRVEKTMFGSLKNILSSNWIKDSDNYVVKLSTETENTLWQVFSVYRIPTTSDYLQIEFNSNEEFLNLANILLNRSNHNFNTTINENDKILTLSTCYNEEEKVVLHAKLIKSEFRN